MSEAMKKGPQPKRDYVCPQLKCYGSAAKLTKTGGVTVADEASRQKVSP
jgi:hypothetical protein